MTPLRRGRQVPRSCLEMLRETVQNLGRCELVTVWPVEGVVRKPHEAQVTVVDQAGEPPVVTVEYVQRQPFP